ncbi:MAG TPA: SpoIID/LytB domain-containing protein [Terracidiphilus sp.]|nr:SpoIID/LytB domain-containing protein [Terracidiphilus sp.]
MWTLWHDRNLMLGPTGPDGFSVENCPPCAMHKVNQTLSLRAADAKVVMEFQGKTIVARRMRITNSVRLVAHNESVVLSYPITVSARDDTLVIAVTLPVERYIERVVASESGPEDSDESLKALAVVVRSFALHQNHGHAAFNLCDSTHCQLLHWTNALPRQAAAHAAVLATAGETLWFHGRRAEAYFGKDCGGQKASPSEIWPRAHGSTPYLSSGADRYCVLHPGNTWATALHRSELSASLAAAGLMRPGWMNLTVARRGESGRAITVKIDETEISAEEFRLAVGQALGWNKIPSTWFEVSEQGDQFLFHGRGWGNGVGLCQKGAAEMATQGKSMAEILQQYFPGAEVADEATDRSWNAFTREGFTLETLDDSDRAFLPALSKALAEAHERSGLHASPPITVRAFASTRAFRDAMLVPGWVSAFSEGQWIGTQPLETLAARRLLERTMRHEFLHALVERETGPRAPLWLREGLVEFWSEGSKTGDGNTPLLPINTVERTLGRARYASESERAHSAAAQYVAILLNRYGKQQVAAWLRSGIPDAVTASLGKR